MANKIQSDQSCNKKSSKKKYVPIEMVNENPLIPGRHQCFCEASQHALINNCLKCGRIVCEQEGPGPCFTCNQHVYSRQEQMEIDQINIKIAEFEMNNKKEQQKINNKKEKVGNLKDIAAVLSLDKANEQKQKLLEFDRNSEKRTKVIDDQFDYFNINQQNWLSEEQRDQVQAKANEIHEKKFVKKSLYHLDLDAGGFVETIKPEIEDFHKKIEELNDKSAFKSDYEFVDFKQIMDREIELHPYYVQSQQTSKSKSKSKSKKEETSQNLKSIFNSSGSDPTRRIRIQDASIMSVHDEGFCLSIQQPHASHTVHGIKLFEGRKWFSPYRGRLWIHSSAKSPRQEEIQEAQQFFKLFNKIPPKFPKKYPLLSLLGCVELVDCLTQEEYRKQYPNGYCDDPFVFVFEDPILLANPLPAPGKLKIFKLDEKQHKAALNQLKF